MVDEEKIFFQNYLYCRSTLYRYNRVTLQFLFAYLFKANNLFQLAIDTKYQNMAIGNQHP